MGAHHWVGVRHVLLVSLLSAALGCDQETRVHVTSAEFLDEKTPDRQVQTDETILLRLDRPLAEDFRVQDVTVRTEPLSHQWAHEVGRRSGDPRALEIRVAAGRPPWRFDGVYGEDREATGLVIDLGDGEQRVDLQLYRWIPVLERCEWEDSSPVGGNWVVDRGDRLRLFFDQPVELAAGVAGERVRVEGTRPEILLTRDSSLDRLDDGKEFARWAPGVEPTEVQIVLGSGVHLKVHGRLPETLTQDDRFNPSLPSGIAVNGTDVLPLPLMVSSRGGPGVQSVREIDIEYPPDFPLARGRQAPAFRGRTFHTVTPFAGVVGKHNAVVAGGKANDTREILSDVLMYKLHYESLETAPFQGLEESLPALTFHHSATALTGQSGTFVVLAGGLRVDSDSQVPLGNLTVVHFGSPVQPLKTPLRVPRWGHAAVAVGEDRLLVDGGWTIDEGEGKRHLVGCAELLSFEATDGGEGGLSVKEHQVFRSLARTDHSLTLLSPGRDGERWVLAYGGFGRNLRRREEDFLPNEGFGTKFDDVRTSYYPPLRANVLISPVLIRVDNPRDSLASLEYDWDFPLLRRGHQAVGLDVDPEQVSTGALSVLIVGGAVTHPTPGNSGAFEIDKSALPTRLPQSADALDAVQFVFDPDFPEGSHLEVIPHSAPDASSVFPRIHATATFVPGLGVVVAGGELDTGNDSLTSIDVYLPGEKRLTPYALALSAPRTRHQAIVVEKESGERSLLLIGGQTRDAERLAAVEEVPLPPRAAKN